MKPDEETQQHNSDLFGDLPTHPGNPVFEISVFCSAPEWPTGCEGYQPVLNAVQQLLEAASQGNETDFTIGTAAITEAVYLWQVAQFGIPENDR